MRFNPPPNWPVPQGWTPPHGWMPDPSWPPTPPGWQFWVDDAHAKTGLNRRATIALVGGVIALVVIVTAAAISISVIKGHNGAPSPPAEVDGVKAIRVTSSNLITAADTGQPKVVLSLYEDFLCPFCRRFEETYGAAVSQLIESGQVAADYYMVSILDRGNRDYSSRAGAAAYCVADQSIDAFRRFHAALYADQPSESASSFPDNSELIGKAQEAGAGGAADCINNGTYRSLVKGQALKADIDGTPTIRINGEDFDPSTPDELLSRVKQLVEG
ncbi:MAG TPA: thioredoxin domain-containing protein [Mycobacterium sp.]|jgi:protein-disulfide isomerase